MKYPFDRFVAQTSDKTLSVEAILSKRTAEDDSPQMVFSKFARFVLTLIKNADKKSVKMNIPVDVIKAISLKTAAATSLQVQQECTCDPTYNTPAFTERFRTGTYAGKSPAEILIENPGDKGKEILKAQNKWLKDNLSKYPSNQKLIDAIREAASMASKLSSDMLSKTNMRPVTILDIGVRPLVRNTRSDGKSFCYEGKVTWDFSKKYPVTVTVSNYYAPVVKRDNGTLNVQVSQKDGNETIEFSMTMDDWIELADRMMRSVDIYERIYMPQMIKMAENAHRQNCEAASSSVPSEAPTSSAT